jgi:enoyl-[acyl-carrier protein] reductase III
MTYPLHETLLGKTALITGGARGIGKAIALKLAQHGVDIIIAYYNSADEAEQICSDLKKMGRRALAVQVNVADERSVAEMMEKVKEHFEHIDILVSNAASGVLKPALKMSTKHWRWCLETNALALNHLAIQVKPFMPKGGRILALSSLGAIRAIPNYAFIGASKAALESLVRSLSIELAPDGISVNTISAGIVDTDALKYFPNREELLEECKERSLGGRLIEPADVANVAYLLCLPESEMIKGQTIFVDAGHSIIG